MLIALLNIMSVFTANSMASTTSAATTTIPVAATTAVVGGTTKKAVTRTPNDVYERCCKDRLNYLVPKHSAHLELSEESLGSLRFSEKDVESCCKVAASQKIPLDGYTITSMVSQPFLLKTRLDLDFLVGPSVVRELDQTCTRSPVLPAHQRSAPGILKSQPAAPNQVAVTPQTQQNQP